MTVSHLLFILGTNISDSLAGLQQLSTEAMAPPKQVNTETMASLQQPNTEAMAPLLQEARLNLVALPAAQLQLQRQVW